MGRLFENIVRKIYEEASMRKDISELPGSPIPHDNSAFTVGDTLVFRGNAGVTTAKIANIGKIGEVETARIMKNQDPNETVLILKRNVVTKSGETVEKTSFRKFSDPNIICCLEWLPAILQFNKGVSNRLSGKNGQKVFYEVTDNISLTKQGETVEVPSGILVIVIKDVLNGKNWYFKHSDASFLGISDLSAEKQGKSKAIAKKGVALPITASIDSVTKYPGMYFPLAEDWVVFDKGGNIFGWNLDEAEYIGAMCPWLLNMDTKWTTGDRSKVYQRINPFRENGVFPPIEPVQVPDEFKHLFRTTK